MPKVLEEHEYLSNRHELQMNDSMPVTPSHLSPDREFTTEPHRDRVVKNQGECYNSNPFEMAHISFNEIEEQARALQQRETIMRVNLKMMKIPRIPHIGDGTENESSTSEMTYNTFSKIADDLRQNSQS